MAGIRTSLCCRAGHLLLLGMNVKGKLIPFVRLLRRATERIMKKTAYRNFSPQNTPNTRKVPRLRKTCIPTRFDVWELRTLKEMFPKLGSNYVAKQRFAAQEQPAFPMLGTFRINS